MAIAKITGQPFPPVQNPPTSALGSTLVSSVNQLIEKSVAGIKGLPTTPQTETVYTVIGFTAISTTGGGHFVWRPELSKSLNDGSAYIAPEAIAAWDGSIVNISQLIDWTGAGDGVWVLIGSMMSPEPLSMEGRLLLEDLPETNFYLTNATGVTDLPTGWPQGRYIVKQVGSPTATYCHQEIIDVGASGSNGGFVCRHAERRMRNAGSWSDWFEILNTNSLLYKELTPTVADIAALKLRVGASDNQQVIVSEYTAGTDAGGGGFTWNSTSTATADDVTIVQVTAVATGRWFRNYSVLTPEMAGAVLDNTTDSTAAIQRAVTTAIALGCELYWPDGIALVTANIANFYSAVHRGKGAIRRGADTFYITPTPTQTNTIYVATTGSDTNDGLTAALPLLTGQKAIDNIVARQFFVLPGNWIVQLAAGTYPRIRLPDNGLLSQNVLYIQGPNVGGTPNAPTAIIKEGATQSGFGILATKARLMVKDVKIEDYNGSTSSSGVRVNNGDLYTDNAHFEDCYYGAAGIDWSLVNIKGGVFNDCGFLLSNPASGSGHAIRGLFHAKFEVGTQNAGTLVGAPIIQNCAGAVRAQENSTGHVDFTDIKDCNSGIRLLVSSRLNVDGSSFKRIVGSALYGTQGCHVDTTTNTIFGTGADANGRNYTGGFGCTASAMGVLEFNAANSANWGVAGTTHPNTAVSTTTNTVLSTLTINVNSLNDTQYTGIAAKSIRFNVKGQLAGGTGVFKRVFIRFGGSLLLCSFPTVATGAFQAVFQIDFIGTNSQYASVIGPNLSNTLSPMSSVFWTESTSTDKVLTLEAVVDNAADTITIQSVEIEQRGF